MVKITINTEHWNNPTEYARKINDTAIFILLVTLAISIWIPTASYVGLTILLLGTLMIDRSLMKWKKTQTKEEH